MRNIARVSVKLGDVFVINARKPVFRLVHNVPPSGHRAVGAGVAVRPDLYVPCALKRSQPHTHAVSGELALHNDRTLQTCPLPREKTAPEACRSA